MASKKQIVIKGFERSLIALVVFVCFVLPFRTSLANDIQVTNLTIHPHSGGNGEVEFDITWSNSWRVTPPLEPYNWDAAWVFCKIRRNGGDWTHLKLDTSGHTIPQSPIAISTANGLADTGAAHNASTNPVVGIFMYRTNDGFGTFTANDVRLRWKYADNGASSGDVIEIRVLAIEMVYIPDGAFYAGDNATSLNAFREKSTGDNDPWYISSEAAIATTASTTGNFYYPGSDYFGWYGDPAGSVFTIPPAFPKGYGAFYMMKGEVSQGQYVAFFNTLTDTQKSTRDITSASGKNSDNNVYRNNIRWSGSGEATLNFGTFSGTAMNYMSWADLTALLDWSGLRPMSELEYEKAGRGSRGVSSPITAVSGEYAWGSTSITRATSVTNSGATSERGQSGSNIAFNFGVQGPLRVGSFAKGANTRVGAGAGFYGVMELSGNLWESAVTVGLSNGRAFEGRYHGNGVLDSSGDANVTSWPASSQEYNSIGAGGRGGAWDSPDDLVRLSNRNFAVFPDIQTRSYGYGGRGVRSVSVDNTPNALNWNDADASGSCTATTNSQTIAGISSSITLELSEDSSGLTLQYSLNGGAWTSFGTLPATLSVSNNDTLAFRSSSGVWKTRIFTVKNVTDGNVVLDAFTLIVSCSAG
ncbi:MAG: SUMF1/EgtB/PvdO family nonheme iron enzyme [Pseudomonadota bacterium]